MHKIAQNVLLEVLISERKIVWNRKGRIPVESTIEIYHEFSNLVEPLA